MTTTLTPPPAETPPSKPRDTFNGRRGPRFTKENARAMARLGQDALKAKRARADALAAAALAAGNADLEVLFRGSLNATLEVLLQRYRAEVNRSPLRPKQAQEVLALAAHNAKLLGISLERPRKDSAGGSKSDLERRPNLVPTLAPAPPDPTPVSRSAEPLPASTKPTNPVDEPTELESAPID